MQVATLLTVPEDFDFNPQSGKHGDRTHRMELRRASVEYVAPSEYMVGTLKCTREAETAHVLTAGRQSDIVMIIYVYNDCILCILCGYPLFHILRCTYNYSIRNKIFVVGIESALHVHTLLGTCSAKVLRK